MCFHSGTRSDAYIGDLKGLDENNQPLWADFDLTKPSELEVLKCAIVRDLDWKDDTTKPLNSSTRLRAAQGQRCGTVAPVGGKCD